MKRAKPKKKKQHITMTQAKVKQMKWDATKEATDMATMLFLTAAADELDLDIEQVARIKIRSDRYAGYIEDHLARIEDLRKSLEKRLGVTIKGWV